MRNPADMARLVARPRLLVYLLAVLGLAVLIVVFTGRGRSSQAPRTLELEMQASAGTVAQLFWSSDVGFVEERSSRVPLLPTPDAFQHLRFPLPPASIRWLRFDPIDAPGEVLIDNVRLLDANGRVLETFDPQSFKPANQIASITRQGEVTKIATTPAATDPSLVLPFGRRERFSVRDRLSLVTPLSLALVCTAAFALLAACVLVIGRTVFEREQGVGPSPTPAPSRWRAALWLTALFLVAFSAKLLLMRDNPVTVPFWDPWDGEASVLFVPFSESGLGWRTMFALHNEHRVFFTRLLALALLEVNGQWDPRLESVANAAMHSLTAVLLVSILWISSGRRRLDLLVVVCALVFVPPFAWENTLFAFQSAFYFLLLFSVLAFWLTTRYRVATGPWWLGWLCAVCGLFTAASGVLVPVAIAGMVALKWAGDRREWREAVVNGGAAVLVVALGVAVASPPLAYHVYLKAKTATDFLGAFGRDLAWPWINRGPLSVVMWLPFGALLAAALLRRGKTTELERLVAGFGIFVVLSAGALAYGRGAGAGPPATRYMDFLSLGLVTNSVALVAMLDRTRAGTMARHVALGALLGWLLFAIIGVDWVTGQNMEALNAWRQFFPAHASNVRRFIAAGDVTEFVSKHGPAELPYPDAKRLATLLQEPEVRRILPAAVRQPLHVEPRVVTNDAFVTAGPYAGSIPSDPLARSWWSLSEQGRKAQGRFESRPLVCQLGGLLKFQVSGYLGWKGQYLAVKDLRTGQDLSVTPSRLAREGWTDAFVSCPPGPFEIVAIDETPESWFGFREPVEVGWASVVSESLIEKSRAALVVLLAMAVLLFAIRWT